MIKLTREKAEELFFEGGDEEFSLIDGGGAWEGESKYFYKSIIFKNKLTNQYFRLDANKSGSHFSDWHYDFTLDCPEVQKIKKIVEIEEWKEINT